jgi:hypothetical protein
MPEHVVAYGCAHAGRLYRALAPGFANREYQLTIPTCPGCGESHVVKAMPRPRRRGERCDLTLAPATTDPGASRRRVSNEEILDAIPSDEVLAAEVAERLGYDRPQGLLRRIERNAKLRDQIEVIRHGPGRPITLRRTDPG